MILLAYALVGVVVWLIMLRHDSATVDCWEYALVGCLLVWPVILTCVGLAYLGKGLTRFVKWYVPVDAGEEE